MPGEQDLIQIIDLNQSKEDIRQLIAALGPLKEEIKNFSGISIATRNTSGMAEFRQQAQQIADGVERIRKLEIELDNLREKHSVNNRQRTDQEIADSQKNVQATRDRVAVIRAEGDAYKQLILQARLAKEEFQRLSAQYGVHSTQAKAAGQQSLLLNNQIQAIAKSAGDARTGVGRYTQSIKDFANQALQLFGAFYLIQKGFTFIRDSLKEYMDAETAATRLAGILANMGRSKDLDSVNRNVKEFADQFKTIKTEQFEDVYQRLYTFGRLSANQMKELIPLIADFATKQGVDLAEATSVLTKAMEGNNRGLRDYGINIKDGKDVTERFSIIMKELGQRTKDAELLFEGTLPGAMKKTEVEVEELQKGIGKDMIPVMKTWYTVLSWVVGGARDLNDWVKNLYTTIKNGGDITAAIFTNPEAVRDAAEAMDNRAKKLADFYIQGDKFKDKDLKDQQNMSNAYENQLKIQQQLYDLAVKKAKVSGAVVGAEDIGSPFDNARARAAKDKAAVEAIKERMITTKYMIQQAHDLMTGNAVVKPESKTGDGGDLKDLKDYAEEFKKILESVREFNHNAFGIDVTPLQKELNSAFDEYNKFFLSIRDLREKDQVEITQELKKGDITFTQAINQRKVVTEKSDEDLLNLETAYQNNVKAIQVKFAKEAAEKLEEQREKALQKAIQDNQKIGQELAKKADEGFRDPVASAKLNQMDDKSPDTDLQKQKKVLDAEMQLEIAGTYKMYNAKEITTLEFEEKLAEIKKKYRDESTAADLKAITEVFDKVKSYSSEAENLIGGLIKANAEKNINAAQKQIDMNNKLKETETRNIAASTLSNQEKAAQLIILDKQVEANNEVLQRKQRDEKIKEAKFDHDAAIANIILTTAQAVIHGIETGITPVDKALNAALAAAVGAAELAVAIATPIPKYAKGTPFKPVSGPMIVGEEGPEIMIEPSGKASITPGVPTLVFGHRGTEIITYQDAVKMATGDVYRGMWKENPRMQNQQIRMDKTEELLTALLGASQVQIQAMKKRQPIHNHIHINTAFEDHINRAVRN